jgi:hypothetical protein
LLVLFYECLLQATPDPHLLLTYDHLQSAPIVGSRIGEENRAFLERGEVWDELMIVVRLAKSDRGLAQVLSRQAHRYADAEFGSFLDSFRYGWVRRGLAARTIDTRVVEPAEREDRPLQLQIGCTLRQVCAASQRVCVGAPTRMCC